MDAEGLAVYLRRPFSPIEALFWTEACLTEVGIPVSSLEEVELGRFVEGR